MALIIVGILALAFGAYRFVDAAVQIQNNAAFKAENSGQETVIQDQTQGQLLFAAGIQYRKLLAQRNEAMIIAGAGLVILAGGWLGNDVLRARSKAVAVA